MKSLIVRRVGVAVLWVLGGGMVGGVAVVPATGPATRGSDEQQIREVAKRLMDGTSRFDVALVDDVVTSSELERRFAAELLRSFRAEREMFGRCAAAAGGGENSAAVLFVKNADTMSRLAIESGKLEIDGDTATLEYKAGGQAVTLYYVRDGDRWKNDFLKRYRERGQVNEQGIARSVGRQKAAALTTEIYETGKEKNITKVPMLYETMAIALTPEVKGAPTTRP